MKHLALSLESLEAFYAFRRISACLRPDCQEPKRGVVLSIISQIFTVMPKPLSQALRGVSCVNDQLACMSPVHRGLLKVHFMPI